MLLQPARLIIFWRCGLRTKTEDHFCSNLIFL
jgi:hypothetical protein